MHLQNVLFYLQVSKFCIQPFIFPTKTNHNHFFCDRRRHCLPVDVDRGEKHWTFHLPGKKTGFEMSWS